MAINYNGQDIPSFVKVKKIDVSVLPPVSQTLLQIRGRAGAYDFGNTFGTREIKVDYQILASNESDLRSKIRTFSTWLYNNEAQQLILLDEPDKYFLAKVTGNTDIDEVLRFGEGSLSFLCSEPFSFSPEQTVTANPTNTNPVQVTNNGNTSTYPSIEVEFTADTTDFAIVSDNEYLHFGKPAITSGTAKTVDVLVLNDEFTSMTGWTTATSVDDGTITGAFSSDGQKARQASADYGTGTKWHGASAVKSLSKQVQDFSLEMAVELGSPSNVGEIGRIEVYLLDSNGSQIGKMAIADGHVSMHKPYVESRAGVLNGGKYFLNTANKSPSFPNFIGILRMARRGNIWTAYIARKDSKGHNYNSFDARFVDTSNQYMNQVASVQIHIGAYSTYPACSNMYIYSLKVWEEDVPLDTEVPHIFHNGDKLFVNSATGEILKNGDIFFSELDPSSNYIKLEQGVNGISFSPAIVKNVEIKYKERWL